MVYIPVRSVSGEGVVERHTGHQRKVNRREGSTVPVTQQTERRSSFNPSRKPLWKHLPSSKEGVPSENTSVLKHEAGHWRGGGRGRTSLLSRGPPSARPGRQPVRTDRSDPSRYPQVPPLDVKEKERVSVRTSVSIR